MKNQISRFRFALRGIIKAVNSESHLRFHLTAMVYVFVFSPLYEFSAVQYAILAVTVAFVIVLEILNTCIEEICNFVAERYEPVVRLVKDMAAGAVLAAAISAAVVGVLFFWNVEIFGRIIGFFALNPALLGVLLLSAVASAVFVALGPTGIREKWILHRHKKRKN